MKTRTAFILVLVTGAIMLVGFVGVALVVRGARALRQAYMTETARQEFVGRWKPPVQSDTETVLPRAVQGFDRETADEAVPWQNPDLGLTGTRGVYQRPGRTPVEVFIAHPTPLETEAILKRVRDHYEGRTGSRSQIQVPGRLRIEIRPPLETIEVWTIQGWLFVFRSSGELEADWIRAYLTTLSARPGA